MDDAKLRVVIRADASVDIGYGHLVRCRSLARYLSTYAAQIIFVCESNNIDYDSILQNRFEVALIERGAEYRNDGTIRKPIENSLKNKLREVCDADQSFDLIKETNWTGVDWIIVDKYTLTYKWENHIKRRIQEHYGKPPRILIIDDLANRKHSADILVDQGFTHRAQQRYDNLVDERCIKLLGPKYSLLSPEYSILHEILPPRSSIKKILVYFGGSNIGITTTTKVLKALSDERLKQYAVDVAVNAKTEETTELEKLVNSRPNTYLYTDLSSLAGLIVRADFGIGAGGGSIWERACLKLPSLVISIAKNQQASVNFLEEAGLIYTFEENDDNFTQSLAETLLKIFDNKSHPTGETLTDGKGCSHIIEQMIKQSRI